MKIQIGIIVLLLAIISNGCGEKKTRKRIIGEWNLVELTATDTWGFSKPCTGSGTLKLMDDGSYTMQMTASSDYGNYNANDFGNYELIEDATNILFFRTNPMIDTIDVHLFLVTRTDLKISYRDPDSNLSYLAIFEKN